MRFKLFGIDFYISFLFMAVITLLLFTDKTGLCLPALIACGSHEAGHLLAMTITKKEVKSISLIPGNVNITKKFCAQKKGDTFVLLAGSGTNFIIFVALLINYYFEENIFILNCALINLMLGVFNLLPVKGLDGGDLVFAAISRKSDLQKAEKVLRITSVLSLLIILFFGILSANEYGFNVTVIIVAIYIIIYAVIKT